jgi:tetratricopeptide (TPR) repeat protein
MNTNFNLYNEILAAGPSPGTLYLILSKMKEEGELKRVIQESIKALMTYPSDIFLRKLLAETYMEDGQASMAENEFLKVTGHINDLISAYKSQAQIYVKQKRDEDARKFLKLYLAHYPDDEEASLLLSSLLPSVDTLEPEAAQADLGEEVITPPAEETTEFQEEQLPDIATPTLAEIYFKQGQIQDARDIYEKVVAEHPDDEKSSQRLKELKAILGDSQTEEDTITEPPVEAEEEKLATDEFTSEEMSIAEEDYRGESVPEDPLRIRTEKTITVLEDWLRAIQEGADRLST